MDRRNFLKLTGVAGGTLLAHRGAAAAVPVAEGDTVGLLIDTTYCIGCRSCEEACAREHGLPVPDISDESVFDAVRDTSERQWTLVNRFRKDGVDTFVKKQCMHCLSPACATACLTKAMERMPDGPVVWNEARCMGCRYCMVSCPFDVPKFEYASPVPKIQKCRLCWEELRQGKEPICVQNCSEPGRALQFGQRSELLREARRRIATEPGRYVDHIYGESEAGGTSVLYLAGRPFDALGMRTDLGTAAFPEYTKPFLYSVPVILGLWPALMLGLHKALGRDDDAHGGEP